MFKWNICCISKTIVAMGFNDGKFLICKKNRFILYLSYVIIHVFMSVSPCFWLSNVQFIFKGSVEVPLDSIPANSEVEKWLPLRLPGTSPRPPPKNASNKNDQLSIRVKVKYQVMVKTWLSTVWLWCKDSWLPRSTSFLQRFWLCLSPIFAQPINKYSI